MLRLPLSSFLTSTILPWWNEGGYDQAWGKEREEEKDDAFELPMDSKRRRARPPFIGEDEEGDEGDEGLMEVIYCCTVGKLYIIFYYQPRFFFYQININR